VKSSGKTIAGIFGLVLLGGLLSAGVFVLFGSQLAVYAAAAIAPMLVVVGGLWVRRRIASTGTDQAQYTRRRAREVGESFTDVWEKRERIRREYTDVFGDGLGLGVDAVIADLGTAGVDFDRENGAFTLDGADTLEDINSLATRIEALDRDLDKAFGERVRQRIQAINGELERIDDLVPASRGSTPADVPDDDWTAAGTQLDDAREAATEQVDSAAETIQNTVGSTDDVDRETVEGQLAEARAAAAADRFGDAVTALLDTRDIVRREGESAFSTVRASLRSLLDTIEASDTDEYLTDTDTDVGDIQRAVADLDDAMELSALTEHREATRDVALAIVEELADDLDAAVAKLGRADIPDGYYTVPDAHDRRFTTELRETSDLQNFEIGRAHV
jgi:hypothetical protein